MPRHASHSDALEYPVPRHVSRRLFLQVAGAAAILVAAGMAPTTEARGLRAPVRKRPKLGAPPISNLQSFHANAPYSYFHGFFNIRTPDEAASAAALGVNYVINYGDTSPASLDPDAPLGKALARYGMKSFLNIQDPYLQATCGGHPLDESGVRQFVARFKDSPLLAGYWTKDDDCSGSMGPAVLRIAQLIRSVDPNPHHLIMPGFGDSGSVYRNYRHGQGDVLGFYPYPAYSRGPAYEVPRMLHIVRARTPRGAHVPAFIGIYQDFATPPRRPVPSQSNILRQVQTYLHYGAVGVAGWGWEAVSETHVPANDPSMRPPVGAVTSYLRSHGYRG